MDPVSAERSKYRQVPRVAHVSFRICFFHMQKRGLAVQL